MSEREPATPGRPEGGRFEIRLKGHLDARWAARFDGLHVRREGDGTTVVHGPIVDQAALHGLLLRVRDAGLPLVSVTRMEADERAPGPPGSQARPIEPTATPGDHHE